MIGLLACSTANGQSSPEENQEVENAGSSRILLVLPFDNRSGQPNLEWIREAAGELLSSRFTSAGFSPMSRAERLYALDHLGLPEGFQPSRASSLKLAQTLEKSKNFDEARVRYEEYLAILKDGPSAIEAKKALERLKKP